MLKRTCLWLMIVSFAAAALLGIAAIIFEDLGPRTEEILVTAMILGIFSFLALGCAIAMGKHRVVPVMWFGIGASIVAGALWTAVVWFDLWYGASGEVMMKSTVSATFAASWAVHLGLLMILRLDTGYWRLVRSATLLVAGLFCGLTVLALWMEADDDVVFKTLAVFAILTAAGTAATPVLGLIEHLTRRETPGSMERRVIVQLICPRCEERQPMSTGSAHCRSCGLRINIDIEEPRCVCGYLLYRLAGATCPECGRAVPPEARWGDAAVVAEEAG